VQLYGVITRPVQLHVEALISMSFESQHLASLKITERVLSVI